MRLRAFWQVERQQFPAPMEQSKLNLEMLVGGTVNRDGHIKCSAAVIGIKPNLPWAAETARRKRCCKTRPQRWIGEYRSPAKQIKQSLWAGYFGHHSDPNSNATP